MYLPGIFNNKIINHLDSKNKRHYKVFFAEHIKDNLMLRYTNPYSGEVSISPLAEIMVEIIYIGARFIEFIAYYPMFMFRIILWIIESFHDNHKMSFYIIERTEIRGTLISFAISAWFIWQHKDILLPWL